MCDPMRYDPTSRKRLLIAIRRDTAFLALDEYSLVSARKIGLPPSGSTMGNSALRIRNRFFPTSAISFLQVLEYSRVRLPPRVFRSFLRFAPAVSPSPVICAFCIPVRRLDSGGVHATPDTGDDSAGPNGAGRLFLAPRAPPPSL